MVFTAGKHTEHTVGGTFDYYSAFFMTTHHIFCFGDKKALTSMIYKTLLDLSAMYVLLNQVATKALMKYERPKKKRYAGNTMVYMLVIQLFIYRICDDSE